MNTLIDDESVLWLNEYTQSKIKLFIVENSKPVFIEEYIDYSKWSENRLKYLDTILDNAINNLIEKCNNSIFNYRISNSDRINTKLKAKEVITRIVKENNEKLRDTIQKLDISIKKWYIENYPNDDLGTTLSSTVTFLDLNNLLNSGKGDDVYELLGGYADSVIRERCFEKLAELTKQNYNAIYNKWLNLEDKEDEIVNYDY